MCDTLTDEGFMEAVVKLPLLEHLEVSYCSLSEEDFLKAAGQSSLSRLDRSLQHLVSELKAPEKSVISSCNIYGNGLTNKGLNAILDSCPHHLVHLDIRKCLRVDFDGDMAKRCL
ncbi:unnamed protein product [Brassica oleracea]|uniref:Uncharacterized protein n=1 Tax=Brassica oleracea TaxID=3712 RepID=A0A3P6ANS0_BRAOL|nr:unnamed protein product [Brassica oleracea]